MNKNLLRFVGAVAALLNFTSSAAIRYVDVANTTSSAPYTNWITAATNIQDAIDAADPGDQILVTNGVYQTGGLAVNSALTNRVAINKVLTVQSVNGPGVTVIQGYQLPGTTNGDEAVRCVYLASGATLSGFTLMQGATLYSGDGIAEQSGGGIFAEDTNAIISNCIIVSNVAYNGGGGAYGGTYLNCVFTDNFAQGNGGGISSGVLNNCTLTRNHVIGNGGGADSCTASNSVFTGNLAYHPPPLWQGGGGGGANNCKLYQCSITSNTGYGGGGVRSSTLTGCLIASNSVSGQYCGGGGIESCVATSCTITGNQSAEVGGGVDYSALTNCIIANNRAGTRGGGYWSGFGARTLNNCLVIGNTAGNQGGGVYDASLYNCTVVNNSAAEGGGGYDSSFYNSVVYQNDAAYNENHIYGYFENSCTTPLPVYGANNVNVDPQLADSFHLSAASPCRGLGNPIYALVTDLDGEAWSSLPDIGCDQFHAGAITGALNVAIDARYTNVAVGFAIPLTALITGHAASNRWDFGDGVQVTNQPFTFHRWQTPGDYTVTLTVYNETSPAGVSATMPVHIVAAPVHYVSLASVNPVAPFTSWAAAATNIQDAIDAASIPGSVVLVSNGVYNVGGRIAFGILTNRVAVTATPVNIRSVNGASATTIQGNPVIGNAAVRCLWLTNGSALQGFTITQGATRDWHGDEPREISGGGVWCQSINVMISDCTFVSNSASWDGGGLVGGTVSNCNFIANFAGDGGGGAAGGILTSCVFTNNSADGGGGVWGSEVSNSFFLGNNGGNYGGGADESELRNCVLIGNNNTGVADCVLHNCSVLANNGIGVKGQSKADNCLVFFNYDGNGSVVNYSGASILKYCCTTPLPAGGVGNISVDPQLSDWFHLSASSPCRGAGNPSFASGTDIDGQPWINPPSIGADEYYSGAVGSLSVAVTAAFTNVAVNFADNFTVKIIGHASSNRWDFGDGTFAMNQLSVSHAWTTPGDYVVTLTAYNDDNAGGISASAAVHVIVSQHYVAAGNVNPSAPYSSWTTAATNIQDAINAAAPGGKIYVSNGVYQVGGAVGGGTSNRVAATIPLTIQSINGPASTFIDGMAAARGVYLTNGAALFGFTVTNGNAGGVVGQSLLAVVSNCVMVGNAGGGAAQCTVYDSKLSANSAYSGGGASGCALSNCLLTGNIAFGEYGGGGGAADCTLNNCIVSNNIANGGQGGGGGLSGGVANNCVIVGNSGRYAGGVNASTLNNCTIISNSAAGAPWSWGGGTGNCGVGNSAPNNCIVYYNTPSDIDYPHTANYCCTTAGVSGPGNLTNEPVFVDLVNGNFHLQSNSPCINAGNNSFATFITDLDGNARVIGGTVDIGAYENQSPALLSFYNWLLADGLSTYSGDANLDSDGDGMSNWQEWRAGTNPTNSLSLLKLLSVTKTNPVAAAVVEWQSSGGIQYYVQRSTNLGSGFVTIQTNLIGNAGLTSFVDVGATNQTASFYRVGVQ